MPFSILFHVYLAVGIVITSVTIDYLEVYLLGLCGTFKCGMEWKCLLGILILVLAQGRGLVYP